MSNSNDHLLDLLNGTPLTPDNLKAVANRPGCPPELSAGIKIALMMQERLKTAAGDDALLRGARPLVLLTTCQGCSETMLREEATWINDEPYHQGCIPAVRVEQTIPGPRTLTVALNPDGTIAEVDAQFIERTYRVNVDRTKDLRTCDTLPLI